jgi:hypothetical protein
MMPIPPRPPPTVRPSGGESRTTARKHSTLEYVLFWILVSPFILVLAPCALAVALVLWLVDVAEDLLGRLP